MFFDFGKMTSCRSIFIVFSVLGMTLNCFLCCLFCVFVGLFLCFCWVVFLCTRLSLSLGRFSDEMS